MHTEIKNYNSALENTDKIICDLLVKIIDKYLSKSESKVWHSHPVWFIDGNPIVGYAKRKNGVVLLFWSGQSFVESKLKHIGKFKAAQLEFTNKDQIDETELTDLLNQAELIQWDYKNIVKRKGKLEKLTNF